MSTAGRTASFAAALAGLLLMVDATYQVGQDQEAVISRLGRTVATVNAGEGGGQAGLHLKWPLLDHVVRLDRRDIQVAVDGAPILTRDGRRFSLGAAMRYQVDDPVRFSRAFGDQEAATVRLRPMLEASLREAAASAPAQGLIDNAEDVVGGPALAKLQRLAKVRGLGLRVRDVQIVRTGLSEMDAQAAARRMQENSAAAAAALRAQGEASKRERMAEADRDAAAIRGEGERQALKARGRGDAERASILSAAYGRDPDFARFFRRLEAYDQALNPQTTTLVLSPDSNAFLKLFGDGPGQRNR